MSHEWMRQMPSVGPSVRMITLRNIMSSAAAIMLATPSSHLYSTYIQQLFMYLSGIFP
jgi:hypothetical protein